MNRKQRRAYERMSGLRKEYQEMTLEEQAKIRKRKRDAGKKIHQQHVENIHNNLNRLGEEREQDILKGLIDDGMSESEAIEFLNANKKIQESYSEALYQRRQKQNEKLV